MEIKNSLNGKVFSGYQYTPEQKWLGMHLAGAGFVRCTFKPRLMPVYVKDADGNYVTDEEGNKKVGYWSVKIEYTWTNPETGDIHHSTYRGTDENGNPIDISLWAYNCLTPEEAEALSNQTIKDVRMRKGVFQDGDTVRVRYTWDALMFDDENCYEPVGKKREYRQYDAE